MRNKIQILIKIIQVIKNNMVILLAQKRMKSKKKRSYSKEKLSNRLITIIFPFWDTNFKNSSKLKRIIITIIHLLKKNLKKYYNHIL